MTIANHDATSPQDMLTKPKPSEWIDAASNLVLFAGLAVLWCSTLPRRTMTTALFPDFVHMLDLRWYDYLAIPAAILLRSVVQTIARAKSSTPTTP